MTNTVDNVWRLPDSNERVTWDGDFAWFDSWVSDLTAQASEDYTFVVTHRADGAVSVRTLDSTVVIYPGDTIIRQGDSFRRYAPGDPYLASWGPWFAGWDPVTETWN